MGVRSCGQVSPVKFLLRRFFLRTRRSADLAYPSAPLDFVCVWCGRLSFYGPLFYTPGGWGYLVECFLKLENKGLYSVSACMRLRLPVGPCTGLAGHGAGGGYAAVWRRLDWVEKKRLEHSR